MKTAATVFVFEQAPATEAKTPIHPRCIEKPVLLYVKTHTSYTSTRPTHTSSRIHSKNLCAKAGKQARARVEGSLLGHWPPHQQPAARHTTVRVVVCVHDKGTSLRSILATTPTTSCSRDKRKERKEVYEDLLCLGRSIDSGFVLMR
jgi:hypothetical protein